MKQWLKILMWCGLSGGIGLFAGIQIGTAQERKRIDDLQINEWSAYEGGYNQALRDKEKEEEANDSLDLYAGGTYIGTEPEEEDGEMPEDPPVIGDEKDIEEIPELHPQHMIQELITEEEYYANPWGYLQESLTWFTEDNVLYNNDTRASMRTQDEIDQVVGIGMKYAFYYKNGEVLDAIFVKNNTAGTLYRIDRVEDSSGSPTSGVDAPEYEEDED